MVETLFNHTGFHNSKQLLTWISHWFNSGPGKGNCTTTYLQTNQYKSYLNDDKAMHSFSCKSCHPHLSIQNNHRLLLIQLSKSWQAGNQIEKFALTHNFKSNLYGFMRKYFHRAGSICGAKVWMHQTHSRPWWLCSTLS